jgi:NAD-dependent deacetylase
MNLDLVPAVARMLRTARRVVALTGAGVSAESGIPTFRGTDGLWRTYNAADLATPEAFARDPLLVWEWYRWRRGLIRQAVPNDGHRALARLGARLPSLALLTQNVDGLHQRAGSSGVIELHGSIWRTRCAADCGFAIDESAVADPAATGRPVPRCQCGALMRPDVVWFGEPLSDLIVNRAVQAAEDCDLLLAIGTSALVYPAAALPAMAAGRGARIVEINTADTPLTRSAHAALCGPSGSVLATLEAAW